VQELENRILELEGEARQAGATRAQLQEERRQQDANLASLASQLEASRGDVEALREALAASSTSLKVRTRFQGGKEGALRQWVDAGVEC
jgi:septal ring factor EnvC (AmiA/AmiB activator)